MQPKLIIGLNSLSKADWKRFRKYILMHTTPESESYRCFLLLQKQAQKLSQFETSKWRLRYMSQLTEKGFLNILSKLYLWFEEWIVYSNIKDNAIRSGVELVKHFNRNGMFQLADAKAKQVQKLIDGHTKRSPDLDFYQYQLLYYQFYSDNPIKDRNQSLVTELMQAFLKWKDYASSVYLAQLNYWNDIRVLDPKIYNDLSEQLQVRKVDTVLMHLNELILNQDPGSFQYCFEVLKNGEIDQRDDFFTLLTMFLVGFSNKLWHLRKIDNPSLLIEIYEFALEKGVLMNAGKLPPRRFLTTVNILGALTSFEWTNQFIDKWGDSVLINDKKGIKQYAKAHNYFNHTKYEKSLALLQMINIDKINMRANIYDLAIRVYYETKDQNYDQLISSLDKYQAYLRRRDGLLAPNNIKRGKNFLKNVKLLINTSSKNQPIELHKPSSSTKWLLEKVKEMG